MKAYVIKNKEGKYYFDESENDFVYPLNKKCLYNSIYEIERGFLSSRALLEKGTIVPVTIAEGDLEEENRYLKEQNELLIKEENLIDEKFKEVGVDCIEDFCIEYKKLKRAYQSACEKLAYLFGECPYSNMNLQMPDHCEEEFCNNEKYLCWDKYFIEQAKGEKDDSLL